MYFRWLLFIMLCWLPVYNVMAIECSAIFPGEQSFSVTGSTIIGSGNLCNGVSCNNPPSFPPPSFSVPGQAGTFNSTEITPGTTKYLNWGLLQNSEITFTGNGTAILYFISSVAIPQGTKINQGGDPANVLIIINGGLTLGQNAEINAHIYVNGGTSLGNDTILNGALAVTGALSLGTDGQYNFDAADVANIDAPDFCEPPVIPIDHYQIIHNSSELTCANVEITINACAVADCSTLSNQNITLDFLVDGPPVQSSQSFLGSTSFTFKHSTVEKVTLSLANTSPLATNGVQCSNANCEMTFVDAGFVFSAIDNQKAGVTFTDITLTATKSKRAGAGFSCVADETFIDETINVNLAQENLVPSGTSGLQFMFKDASENQVSLNKYASYSEVALYFDTDAIAKLQVPQYLDAGQIRLHVSYSGNTVIGNSNSFWVSPDKLLVSAKSGGDDIDGNSVTANTTHKSGAAFTLAVTALNAADAVTQNYSPGQMQLKLTRTGPTSGANEGKLTYAAASNLATALSAPADFEDVTLTSFSSGVSSYNSASYSEVGLINLDLRDNAYGDASMTVSGDVIDIGRFIPDHYTLDASNVSGWCDNGTQTFTYMDQPQLNINYQLQAQNAAGDVTLNYFDDATPAQDFAKATVTLVAESKNSGDGTTLATRINSLASTWVNGAYELTDTTAIFPKITGNADTKDGPFEQLQFGLTLDDEDGPTLDQNFNMLATSAEAVPCTVNTDPVTDCDAITLAGSANIRFGRWFIENNFGPETENLAIKMSTQYYNGSKFVTHIDDICTPFANVAGTDFTLSVNDLNPAIADIALTPVTGNAGTFTLGEAQLLLNKPTDGSSGQIRFTYDTAPSWLLYDWDGIDSGADNLWFEDSPFAIFSFGQFRGNDRIIYWREQIN